ncbi:MULTISPECIES: molybdate ABC transporter substrate-binding protein [Halocynthiibacter]|uniref:Molybdate ABC transporter substrate-binding protein n=1 Tax=Halocynthiibacter halioticoli TaxID=2986804 RepID=A0AAE3J2Y1_9RHOB|nr:MULTISPECIES: molybdate ABC transporter substrate-binding protein [Halocynthiibacter]MCV6824342.1 molybdate ABC transporter substrate-binding protein [Halocynthiibacter halioticoli]MCW4057343.1 molybdate ABC transporter substrate-binding protein [Halocynthiibacter sp. SDUM655004]
MRILTRAITYWVRLSVWAVGFTLVGHAAMAREVTLAVASNFVPALAVLAPTIEAETGVKLRVVNGATGKLYAQITQGAPFDLFLAADALHVEKYLTNKPDTLHATYAIGQLARLSRPDAPELAQARIAIADPAVAPYGVLAMEALSEAGVEAGELDLVFGPNVSAVAGFLATGNVDIAFVAASQISGIQGFDAEILPEKTIAQDMLLINDTPDARAVFDALQSARVRNALPQLGYLVPSLDKGVAE